MGGRIWRTFEVLHRVFLSQDGVDACGVAIGGDLGPGDHSQEAGDYGEGTQEEDGRCLDSFPRVDELEFLDLDATSATQTPCRGISEHTITNGSIKIAKSINQLNADAVRFNANVSTHASLFQKFVVHSAWGYLPQRKISANRKETVQRMVKTIRNQLKMSKAVRCTLPMKIRRKKKRMESLMRAMVMMWPIQKAYSNCSGDGRLVGGSGGSDGDRTCLVEFDEFGFREHGQGVGADDGGLRAVGYCYAGRDDEELCKS